MLIRLLLTSILALFIAAVPASAQRTVSGTVTDANGEALIGVTVYVKNGNQSAVTDLNGKYSVQVDNDNAVLLFRYVGMEPYQTAVK